MDEKYILVKVFESIIDDIIDTDVNADSKINFDKNSLKFLKNNLGDLNELEYSLKSYLIKTFCYKSDYSQCLKEVRVCFERIIENASLDDFRDINSFILKYTNTIEEKLESNELSSIFIDSIRKVCSDDIFGSVVCNNGNSFMIERPTRADEEGMPRIIIKDIYELEHTLDKFINDIKCSNSVYSTFLKNTGDDYGIPYIFQSVIRNATNSDLLDVERYLRKYDSFITDDTFDDFRESKVLGTFMGDNIYVKLRNAPVPYETPYFLSFYMKLDNKIVELPNIRYGIENIDGKKKAHILATQSSQDNERFDMCDELNNCYKSFLSGVSSFREYNPSHVISIVLALGLFNGRGIKDINIVDYMPFRYQRLVLEGNKNTDELEILQRRLTNKQIYSYLRVCEYFEGIDVTSYPELDNNLKLFLSDDVSTSKFELQQLYDMSYKLGVSINENNIDKPKLL